MAFVVLIYYREKGKKISRKLQCGVVCFILALIFGYLFLPNIYVVNDNGYKKRLLIGRSSVKLNNGSEVYISDNCVINNSSRMLYVETIKYIYSSGYSGRYNVEKVLPYSAYKDKIDYVFKNPPQNIRENVLAKAPFTKKWLREKSYYEE